MKVAVTSQGETAGDAMDLRFGRAKWLIVCDTDTGTCVTHDNVVNMNAASGAGIQTAQNVANLDADVVISGNVGPKAFRTLSAAGVKIFLAPGGSVKDVLALWVEGKLEEATNANVEGHWV